MASILVFIIIVIFILIIVAIVLVIYFFSTPKPAQPPANSPLNGSCITTTECQSGLECQGGLCKGGSGTACQLNTDCRTGLECSPEGFCRVSLGNSCDNSGDCTTGLVCENNICLLPIGSTCNNTIECTSGAVCDNNRCKSIFNGNCNVDFDCVVPNNDCSNNNTCLLEPGTSCVSDEQCVYGICQGGTCRIPPPKPCPTGSNCQNGSSCIDGFCRGDLYFDCSGSGEDSECRDDLFCGNFNPENRECIKRTCALNSDCTSIGKAVCLTGKCYDCIGPSNCATNQTCEGNVCRLLPGELGCTNDTECYGQNSKCLFDNTENAFKCKSPTLGDCNVDSDCINPNATCSGGTCIECVLDSDCSSNEVCVFGGECRGIAGSSCESSFDCVSGTKCINGNCLCQSNSGCASSAPFDKCQTSTGVCVSCLTTADCGVGEVCKLSSGECVSCLSNSDCSGGTPYCDISTNTCVAML